jgi:hypothetical protein
MLDYGGLWDIHGFLCGTGSTGLFNGLAASNYATMLLPLEARGKT